MSQRKLTQIELNLLVKSLNFPIISKTPPNKDINNIEDAVKDLEIEEADTIRAKINLTL